jgi:hypothetical protein
MLMTSNLAAIYTPPGNAWVMNATIKAEAFMTVLAHELTHLLIKPPRPKKPGEILNGWNDGEHLTGAANSADIMFAGANAENRQLATVKFLVPTQVEIWVKSADGLE